MTLVPDETMQAQVLLDTLGWLERAVIGLNLCPFARGVHARGLLHVTVSRAMDEQTLLDDLRVQLLELAAQPAEQRETTLLVAPWVLQDFLDFNDFLTDAEDVLARLGFEGEFQLASFHPRYQFAGTQPDDVTNCSNRSPYPTLHLLREDSLSRAIEAHPDTDAIYQANITRLQALGMAGWHLLNVAAGQGGSRGQH